VTVRSDTPAWLGAEPDEDAGVPDRRRWTLLAAAVVPWLIVLALLLTDRSPTLRVTDPDIHAGHDTSPPADRPPGHPELAAPDRAAAPSEAADTTSPAAEGAAPVPGAPMLAPSPTFGLPSPEWRSPNPDLHAAAALAIVVARAWLTDVSPRLLVPGIEPPGGNRYAEHLVVETIDAPAADAAVATVLAVLLEDGDPLSTRVRRIAVPLALDPDGARPGGQPWWLPAPDLSTRELRTVPIDDPAALAAAADALTRAGYLDAVVESLTASPGWPAQATVRAMTPEGEPIAGPVWLRPEVDGYAVAGAPAGRPLGPDPHAPPTWPDPGNGTFRPDPDAAMTDPDAQEPER
jgi:hypothetical protein